MSGGGDLFGVLPDELLNHVLSFLPSREAVQSSLLSRRWRHLWRSTAAVRVRGQGDDFRLFVNGLIIHRKATPLRSFEIDADLGTLHEPPYDEPWLNDDWRGEVDLWVTHALRSCHAHSLTAGFDVDIPWRPRRALTFASPHLTTVHLEAVRLVDGLLDFSCSTALPPRGRVSPSLECLAVVDCRSMDIYSYFDPYSPEDRLYVGISTPRLRFLEISHNYDKEQFLQMMPWMTDDNIRLTAWAALDDG
ncbi:hypothetical protein ACQ4PT_056867 [Festuca glaucescens]